MSVTHYKKIDFGSIYYDPNKPRDKGTSALTLEVTNRCQLRCPGCYMWQNNSISSIELDLETAQNIVLRIKNEYPELKLVNIVGGEPLMWPHLYDFVNFCFRQNLYVLVATNQLKFDDKLFRYFKTHDVTIVGKLSINPEDKSLIPIQAKKIGSTIKVAELMISSVMKLRDMGYTAPRFLLNNLLTKDTIKYAPGMFEWCVKNNIRPDLEIINCSNDCKQNIEVFNEIRPSVRQLKWLERNIFSICQKNKWPIPEMMPPHILHPCKMIGNQLYVKVDGSIQICPSNPTVMANVFDREFHKKLSAHPLYIHRRKLVQSQLTGKCAKCAIKGCNGGCRATVEALTGSFTTGSTESFPFCWK